MSECVTRDEIYNRGDWYLLPSGSLPQFRDSAPTVGRNLTASTNQDTLIDNIRAATP